MGRALGGLLGTLLLPVPALFAQAEKPVTSQEVQDLRREIEGETRPSLELLFDGHTESGDLNNKLNFLKYGARLNLKRGLSTLSFTARRAEYRTQNGLIDGSGTGGSIGLTSKLSEQTDTHVEIGAAHLSSKTWSVTGAASITSRPSDSGHYSLAATRTPIEESYLSAVGLRPVFGPFAGQLVGVVLDNRVTASGTYRFPSRIDVTGEAALGARQGDNVPSNFFKRAGGGIGFDAVAREPWKSPSLVRIGGWVEYFGFDKDRLGYGGASFLDFRYRPVPLALLGSDLISPLPSPGNPGVGGYFSPSSFVSAVARVDVRGRTNPSFEYRLSAFAGEQSFTGSSMKLAAGASVVLNLRATEKVSFPISFEWDNYGPFEQQSISARMVLLF
jgi:hypothetical protein